MDFHCGATVETPVETPVEPWLYMCVWFSVSVDVSIIISSLASHPYPQLKSNHYCPFLDPSSPVIDFQRKTTGKS